MSDKEKTFVHEGIEVKLTGRKAKKELRGGQVDELVEISPADQHAPSFKKWVRMKELYEVV